MLAIVSPGQGAQAPGMLTDWLSDQGFAETIATLSEVAELDLAALGTAGSADDLRDTAVAQPLLTATAIATSKVLGVTPALVAGHSVGEIPAAYLAGVFSASDAVRFVSVRARAMAQAAAKEETSMAAVLGGDPEQVTAALTRLELVAANVNGGGQVVAAGSIGAIAALRESPPERARVIPLQVAGAFHTHFMASAVAQLAEFATQISAADPKCVILSNADGAALTAGDSVISSLVKQVANPVRWDLCLATMAQKGVTGIIELAPGGVLTGLAKRVLPEIKTVAIKRPSDIAVAQELAEQVAAESK